MPLKAIVRIRIPLKRPVPDSKEETGSNIDMTGEEKPVEEAKKEEIEPVIPDEERYPEQELEDKAFSVNPIGESYKVWVMHQAASRWVRKDISSFLRKNIKELDGIDSDVFIDNVEKTAVEVENLFTKMITGEGDVPVFNWEIN